MKRSFYKKLLVYLVCFGLILGSMPANIFFAAIGTGETVIQPVTLLNAGFEEPLNSDGTILGWNRIYGDDTDFSVSDSVYYTGSHSLKVDDKVNDGGKWMYGDKFPVIPGDKLTAKAWVKVEKGAAEFCIKYFDAAGVDVGTYPDVTVLPGEWSQQTVAGTVPDGATQAAVFIYSGMWAVTTAYFDDVEMSKETLYQEPAAGILINTGYESPLNIDGTIPGWNRIYGDDTDFSVSETVYYTGTHSLMVDDKVSDAGKWMYSDKFAVNPGDNLTAKAWVKVDKGAAEFCLKYFNDAGIDVGTYPDTTVLPGVWSQQIVSGIVPEGATQAAVFIYSGMWAVTTAYFDDVEIIIEPVTVPQKFENVMLNYDCLNLISLSDHNWFVGDPFKGAYVTDSTNSTGTPDGVTFKTVPEGQILFYMDQDSGADAVDAFKLVDESNKIDLKPWKLEMDIKFQDLIKANTGNVLSGFSIMVNTGERVNRINFGGDNKIRVETAWNDPYPDMIEKAVDLHIGDGSFHKWSISGDGKGGMSISCDGTVVAEFTNIAFMTDYEPGIQFINYYHAVASGNNEIYFDNMKLSVYDDPSTLLNLDFENELNSDGTISGWNQWYSNVGFTINTDDKYYGNKSLYVNDDTAEASFWLFSNTIPVIQGDMFEAEGYMKSISGTVQVNLAYLDDNGNMVKYFENKFIPAANTWTKVRVSGMAPEGATKAAIFIYAPYGTTGKAYIDDLKLKKANANVGLGIVTGKPVDLGEMVIAGRALMLYSITATNPVTQLSELYTISTGSGDNSSVFYALDPYTGELIFKEQIPGIIHAYAIVQGSDKNIYFAGVDDGKLYRYIPNVKGQGKVEFLGKNPCDTWIWDIAASNDGKIYGATSQTDGIGGNSEVFEYDIATGVFTHLGSVKADAVYARGLGVTDEYLYVGVGMPDALIRINRSDYSEKTEITIPALGEIPGTGEAGRMCGHVWAYNGKLFIRSNAMKLFVIDEQTNELYNILSFEQAISAPSPYNSNIIYYKSKGYLWQYDCETNIAKQVDNSPALPAGAANALNWFTASGGEKAGRQLLGITDDAGGYTVYDPASNSISDVPLQTIKQAVDIQSIEKGQDGKLYIGGYQYGSSIYDINQNKIIYSEPTMDQPEGIGFMNGKVYFGTYGSARVFEYDPTKPFNYNDGTPGNPGLAYDIGNEQDRPFVLTSGDNKLFIGTIPDYGMLGGALTIYDEETNSWSEFRNVVQNQSIIGLAYKDGLLYGGTSVFGGIGADEKLIAPEAKMFIWDVAKNQKLKEFTVSIPGIDKAPKMIGDLSFGPDGLLWGIAAGSIFAIDPDTCEVVKSKVVFPSDYVNNSTWRPYYLRWGNDGLLYTTLGRNIVAFDTNTMVYQVLVEGVSLATLGDDDNIYYAPGVSSRLMKLHIIRDTQYPVIEKLAALNDAINAIDMLPGSYNITLANKNMAVNARALVNDAISKGAAEADINNLDKLIKCEAKLAALESNDQGEDEDQNQDGNQNQGNEQIHVTSVNTITDSGTIMAKPEVTSGVATASITITEFENALAKVSNAKTIKIEVQKSDNADEYVLQLPTSVLSPKFKNKEIEISTPLGMVMISDKMYKAAQIQNAANIKISIGKADISNVGADIKTLIGDRPVVELNAYADGEKIDWEKADTKVMVYLDYTPTEEEMKNPEHIVVWYVKDSGEIVSVPDGKYDKKTGKVSFTAIHFSKYAISYVKKSFGDINTSYAQKQIEVLASKGIINGTSAGTFDPEKNIKRADFIMLLVKVLGLNSKIDGSFEDVKETDYFFREVALSKSLGIAKGSGNNMFEPSAEIPREDMMVLTARALKLAEKLNSKGSADDLARFADMNLVSGYAVDDIGTLVKENIIKGNGSEINPVGKATREEVAVLIYNIYNMGN